MSPLFKRMANVFDIPLIEISLDSDEPSNVLYIYNFYDWGRARKRVNAIAQVILLGYKDDSSEVNRLPPEMWRKILSHCCTDLVPPQTARMIAREFFK